MDKRFKHLVKKTKKQSNLLGKSNSIKKLQARKHQFKQLKNDLTGYLKKSLIKLKKDQKNKQRKSVRKSLDK